MAREIAALLILTALAACGEARGIPADAPPLVIRAGTGSGTGTGTGEVELGKAFPLTVVRTWRREQPPGEWSDALLAPLLVQPGETTLRQDERNVEETRRYRAYAFSLEPVKVAGVFELRVRRALDPGHPGPAELPREARQRARSWIGWMAAAAAALLAAIVVARRRRRREAPVQVEPRPEGKIVPAHLRALDRIERLRGRRPASRDQIEAYYGEAAALVRDFVADRFRADTSSLTSEDLLTRHPSLAGALRHCDLVRFARHDPTTTEREAMLSSLEAYVRESA